MYMYAVSRGPKVGPLFAETTSPRVGCEML